MKRLFLEKIIFILYSGRCCLVVLFYIMVILWSLEHDEKSASSPAPLVVDMKRSERRENEYTAWNEDLLMWYAKGCSCRVCNRTGVGCTTELCILHGERASLGHLVTIWSLLPVNGSLLHRRWVVPTSLSVECSLIFQPSSIATNTSYLFAIEIRHRVIRAGSAGVDSVLLDSVEKSSLLDGEFRKLFPM